MYILIDNQKSPTLFGLKPKQIMSFVPLRRVKQDVVGMLQADKQS